MPLDKLPPEDEAWLANFGDKRIPENAMHDGFIAIISWINPETGDQEWTTYNNMDRPLSFILGLMQMAAWQLCAENSPGGRAMMDEGD